MDGDLILECNVILLEKAFMNSKVIQTDFLLVNIS